MRPNILRNQSTFVSGPWTLPFRAHPPIRSQAVHLMKKHRMVQRRTERYLTEGFFRLIVHLDCSTEEVRVAHVGQRRELDSAAAARGDESLCTNPIPDFGG